MDIGDVAGNAEEYDEALEYDEEQDTVKVSNPNLKEIQAELR